MTTSPRTAAPSVTIVALERRTKRGLMPSLYLAPGVQDGTPDVSGLYAKVELHDVSTKGPITLELSQMPNDGDQWGIDARWLGNGYPVHANGFGARYLMVERANDELAAMLNAAVEAAGL
jgi:hypothetical protein